MMYRVSLAIYVACLFNTVLLGVLREGSAAAVFLLGFLLVGNGIYGIWTIFKKSSSTSAVFAVPSLPKWLIFLGAFGLALVVWRLPTVLDVFEFGTSFATSPVRSESWYQTGEKYFILINKSEIHEITRQQFETLNYLLLNFISTPFIVLSFIGVIIWNNIADRSKAISK